VGAILAAGVALLVVFLTNRHQTAISERTQAELRREASLNREHAAIAEVIAVLSETIALVLTSLEAFISHLAASAPQLRVGSLNPRTRNLGKN